MVEKQKTQYQQTPSPHFCAIRKVILCYVMAQPVSAIFVGIWVPLSYYGKARLNTDSMV